MARQIFSFRQGYSWYCCGIHIIEYRTFINIPYKWIQWVNQFRRRVQYGTVFFEEKKTLDYDKIKCKHLVNPVFFS